MDLASNVMSSPPPPANADYVSGLYRTRDNIFNFRVRVRVKKVTSFSATTSTSTDSGGDDKDKRGSCESVRSSSIDEVDEEVILFWQQKVFSKSELDFYGKKNESDFEGDPLKRKFYHDAQNLLKKNKNNNNNNNKRKIFTSLDGELVRFSGSEELNEEEVGPYVPITDNPDEEPTFLAQAMSLGKIRRRRRAGGQSNHQSVVDKSTIPTSNIVVEGGGNNHYRHNLSMPEVMAIRLDLREDDEGGEEYLDLCVLKYDSNGVLEVTPDFSRLSYRIDTGDRVAYEYWVEHVSPGMRFDAALNEAKMMNDVFARIAHQRQTEIVGDEFDLAPKRSFRMLVNAEIVSGVDFECDGVFVHYFVELPPGWTPATTSNPPNDESQLCGMTVKSFTKADAAGRDVAHFCHTFSVDLLFDVNRFDLERERLPKWPQIFFEVISVDSWTRVRTEGYGFTSIPYECGCYEVNVDTWRPLLHGPKGEMKRYFIGGTPELDDMTYSGTPGYVDGKILSKYGLQTMSSGSVRLRMNVIHQSRAFSADKKELFGVGSISRRNLPIRNLMDRLGSASLFSSVSTVMAAFAKARERFERAKEGYDLNLISDNKVKKNEE